MKKPELDKTVSKNQYESKIRSFADDLEMQITDAENKLKGLADKTRNEYNLKIEELQLKRQKLLVELEKINKASESEWNEIRSKVHSKVDELSSEIAEASEGIRAGLKYLVHKLKDR